MSYRYDLIEETMRSLIACLEGMLPESDIANAKELVNAGEYGVAFDLICNQLYEYDVTINQQIFEIISQSAALMNISSEEYVFVRKLIRD